MSSARKTQGLEVTLDSEEVSLVHDALEAWIKSGHTEAKDLLQHIQEEMYMHYKYPHDWDGAQEVQDTERKLFHFDPFVDGA
tara:strand:+ start:1024 stop:1269 length:246 start_codon:yes stop_codon:yes gene_type:complete